MATSDFDTSGSPHYSPNYAEPPRQRGCLFYGCLFASVAAFLIMVAVGGISFVLFRWLGQQVQQYTATEPVPLPKTQIAEQDLRTLDERVKAFRKALDDGTATAPLILSSTDLNALIESNPSLKDKIFVTLEDEKIKGKISLPLESFAIWPFDTMFKGRFLNGEAEFKVSLENGVLLVLLDSVEVNGKRPPQDALDKLRQQNLTQDAYKDPRNAEQIRKLESIQITDGKVIITARESHKPAAELPKLPDNVLAPPDPTLPALPPPPADSAPKTNTPKPEASKTESPLPK